MRNRWIPAGLMVPMALTMAFAVGCDSTDPFSSGQGHASVLISVSDSGGRPLPGVSVRITCSSGGPTATLQTDSTGRVGANLDSRTAAFPGSGVRLPCRLAEPAQGVPHVALDTVIGFARGPVLVALQVFDIREN